MTTIKLSVEELIFAFYSEGYYEQGMSIKDMYFPDMTEAELRQLLESSARSLLAKDMVTEEKNRYILKEEYKEFVEILIYADKTIKASKFTDTMSEETISYHLRGDYIYSHKLLYDNQVHQVSKSSLENISENIQNFFELIDRASDKQVFEIEREEFESLLESVSEKKTEIASTIKSIVGSEFIEDLTRREGKMNSLVYLEYDQENTPDLLDVCFIIPGIKRSWLITRTKKDAYKVENYNEDILNQFINKNEYSLL
ncbi:hypothetical protein [Metabacillus sp. SLBN-84]